MLFIKSFKDSSPRIRKNRNTLLATIAIFVLAGSIIFVFSRANTPSVSSEAEQGTLMSGAITKADTSASGSQAVQFTKAVVPAGKQAIMDAAGPTNTGIMRSSGSVTITTDGQVLENINVSGRINVQANNVVIRNCIVRGFTSSVVVALDAGYTNLLVENCLVEAKLSSTGQPPNGAMGQIVNTNGRATNMTIRKTEIIGIGDGIKAGDGGLYEYNYIHMTKPSGSDKHLDGIQGSGRSNWRASYNVFNLGHENGGNYSIFAQGFNGTSCTKISNIEFSYNYIYGGNHGFAFAGGKVDKCANPSSYISNVRAINNIFTKDPDGIFGSSSRLGFRYGYWTLSNVGSAATISGNVFEDGTPVVN